MPCWEVRTQTVDMEKIDPDVLADALKHDGASVYRAFGEIRARYPGRNEVTWSNGALTVRDSDQDLIGRVKKAYTKQAAKVAAKKYGFSVKERPNGQLELTRRTY